MISDNHFLYQCQACGSHKIWYLLYVLWKQLTHVLTLFVWNVHLWWLNTVQWRTCMSVHHFLPAHHQLWDPWSTNYETAGWLYIVRMSDSAKAWSDPHTEYHWDLKGFDPQVFWIIIFSFLSDLLKLILIKTYRNKKTNFLANRLQSNVLYKQIDVFYGI